MNIFQKAVVRAVDYARKKSELWVGAGFYIFGNARVSVAQSTEIIKLLVDTCAACINKRAETRGSVKVEFSGPNGHGKTVEGFFFRGNNFTTHAEFVSLCSQDLDVNGNSFWYLDLVALSFVRWDPSPIVINIKEGMVASYQRDNNSPKVAPNLVFHFKRTSNLNRGLIGRSVVDEIFGLLRANLSLNAFFSRYLDSDGVPSRSVEFPKDTVLTPEQIEAMRARYDQLHKASNQSSNVAWLWGGATLQSQGNTEMDYHNSYAMVVQSIRDSFGTPKIAFGNTDHVNFSNGLTSFLMFQTLVVDLFHQKLSDELSYFFKQNKFSVQITYTSRIDTSLLFGLAGNVKGATKQAAS